MRAQMKESAGNGYAHSRRWGIRRKDIMNREGDVYLTRWTFFTVFGLALMLHRMRRPDQDRCLHDHPWWFLTLVLWGGYAEEVADQAHIYADPPRRRQWNRPGMLLYRPALHTHRVSELPNGDCWTLVFRGDYQRLWGFRNALGEWRPWHSLVDWAGSVLWCDERTA